jgi:hypothetical protein
MYLVYMNADKALNDAITATLTAMAVVIWETRPALVMLLPIEAQGEWTLQVLNEMLKP